MVRLYGKEKQTLFNCVYKESLSEIVESEEFAPVVSHETHNKLHLFNCVYRESVREIVESEGFTAVVNHETHNKLPLINCLKGVYERNCGE
jgi:hypothetical protein